MQYEPDPLTLGASGEPVSLTGAANLVIRAGAGYNTIDVQTASALGIYVSNCPGKNAVAVAERAGTRTLLAAAWPVAIINASAVMSGSRKRRGAKITGGG